LFFFLFFFPSFPLCSLAGQNILHRVASNKLQPGMEEVFLELLRVKPALLTLRDNEGNTPISHSIRHARDAAAFGQFVCLFVFFFCILKLKF
jgi:hypothetical protein